MSKRKFKNKKIIPCLIGFALIAYGAYRGGNYSSQIKKIDSDLSQANDEFINIVNENDLDNIEMIAVGNSISNGYSLKDDIVPLLLRNDDLITKLDNNSIEYSFYSFSRPEDNCDRHIYNYYVQGYSISDVNKMVHVDLNKENTRMDSSYITEEDLENYYPTVGCDLSLNDIVNKNDGSSTIIVYNGFTGSFLDVVTRDGTNVFKKMSNDLFYIDAFCNDVYMSNSDVQIYICGVPNILNINATNIINARLVAITEKYPNVSYVKPAPVKVFYNTENGIKLDIHPDKDEYLILNKNIINSINENYMSNKIATDIYKSLIELNNTAQFEYTNYDIDYIKSYIENKLEVTYSDVSDDVKNKALETVLKLFKEYDENDFFYLPRTEIIEYLSQDYYSLSLNND